MYRLAIELQQKMPVRRFRNKFEKSFSKGKYYISIDFIILFSHILVVCELFTCLLSTISTTYNNPIKSPYVFKLRLDNVARE